MAGGEGTRLRPLTSNQPKPMVPIVGKPCMEHILELLKRHGFDDVIVTLAFLPQAIRSYFGDGESLGLNIEYSVEESPLGTAGSVRLASRQARRHRARHLRRRALRHRPRRRCSQFHRDAERGGDDRAEGGREPARVRDRRHRRGRHGSSASSRSRRGARSSRTRSTPASTCSSRRCWSTCRPTGRTTSPRSSSRSCSRWAGRCTGWSATATGRTSATSTSSSRRTSTRSTAQVELDIPGIRLRGNIWIGEGVEIDDLEDVEGPAFIGNYCRISPQASIGPYSVLGASVTLRERARTVRSVIDANTHVGRSALVEGAILGRGCDVRSHVRIQEGAAIGDEVVLGAQSMVLSRRADLPVQGGRVRRAHPREPDLGVACDLGAVRQGRRHRPDQRRPDAGDGRASRRRRSARR